MFTLCFGLLLIKGYLCLKITTLPEISATLKSNSSIILNCTYELEGSDKIKNVFWKKKISEVYNELANVYINENKAYYSADGLYLKNRSEIHGFGNGSTSVVLIIKDVQCIDNGHYQCLITYDDGKVLQKTEKNTVVYIQANAENPKVFSVQPHNSLEEHGMVKLSCVGDVGNPQGSLKIWKIYKTSNTKQLLKNESESISDTENCTHIVNLTTSYNLTKEDNGAVFRCSSQNQYTTEPAPAIDIKPIDVFYGPSTPRIESFFSLSGLHVGDLVQFECISDGNPNPNYTWIFNFTDIVSDGRYKLSANKSELSFTITTTTDSGYYQCVASNYFNGKTFNSSSNVTLSVQEKKHEEVKFEFEQSCLESPCLPVQNCVAKNGSVYCSLNVWIVIAVVFIVTTLILGTTTLGFILSGRNQRLKRVNNTEDVDMGGYLSPVGEANGTSYEALGQNTVHEYSTMQNSDLFSHGSNYEALGEGTVHVYTTMQNRD